MLWHDEMEDEIEQCGVDIGDEDHAHDAGDDAKKFDFVVALHTAREIFGDGAVAFDDDCAGCKDGDAAEEPAPAK